MSMIMKCFVVSAKDTASLLHLVCSCASNLIPARQETALLHDVLACDRERVSTKKSNVSSPTEAEREAWAQPGQW